MKTERKRNLKGAVLFTVISVLALLIIMMTCTLAMAAAANKRSRKTYSSSQSSYTARTAIDSILAAVGTDKDFSKAIRELSVGDEMDVIVELNNASMGSINNAKIRHAGTKQVFDPDPKVMAWVNRNLYIITADVTVGGETTTITSSVLQDPPVNVTTKRNNGAPFLTYGTNIGAANFMSSWGGTYFGMGDWTPDGSQVSKNWQTGLSYNEHDGDKTITTLDDKKYLSKATYKYPNENDVSTPFVVNGNFDASTATKLYYTHNGSGVSNPGIQIWGDLKLSGSNFDIKAGPALKNMVNADSFLSIPYMYVDGTITYNVSDTALGLDDTSIPFNVFCGNIWSTGGSIKGESNIYCMDENKTSSIYATKHNLYTWTKDTIKREWSASYGYIGRNIYSNGNLILDGNNLQIGANVYVKGDLIVKNEVKIGGELVVGGRLIIDNGNILNDMNNNGGKTTKFEPKTIYVGKNEDGTYKIYKGSCTVDDNNQTVACDALEALDLNNYNIKDITEFKGDIYPKNATREVLIGAHWDVKGIEGHVYSLSAVEAEMAQKGETFGEQGGGVPDLITGNYVLTGNISKEITVKPGANQTIYVKLKDVTFVCNKDDKGESKNDAKITVDESAENSHVKFVLEGLVVSDGYDFDNDYDDIAQTKLVKTVYDLMNEFKLEDIDKTPPTGGNAPKIKEVGDPIPDSGDIELVEDWGSSIITINAPKAGEDPRWVVLGKDFKLNNGRIIIDDTGDKKGEVDIFVRNDVTLNGGNGNPALVTKTFMDMLDSGKPIYMFSDNDFKMQYAVCDATGKVLKYTDNGQATGNEIQVFDNLNVYIHSPSQKSDPDVTLNLGNQNYVTAYAQAIKLHLENGSQGADNVTDKVYYDMQKLGSQTKSIKIGWIGLLDIKGFNIGNGWTFLYVPIDDGNSGGGGGGGNVEDAEGKHAYAAVEYNAFLN